MPTEKKLLQLRDDAINGSQDAHRAIRLASRVYNNRNQYTNTEAVANVYSRASESLNPVLTEAINKIKPAHEEAIARLDVQPDKTTRMFEDLEFTDDLKNWLEMQEEVDDEGSHMRAAIHHNTVGGTAVRVVYYDAVNDLVTAPVIDPLTFAPDPSCSDTRLRTAQYVVRSLSVPTVHIKRNYPEFVLSDNESEQGGSHRIDEMWIRRELAEDIGIGMGDVSKQMVRATLIDDRLARVSETPFWWPDFPFSCWRNLLDYEANGKPASFWGIGYATLLWPSQKLLDHFLANLALITNNLAVGRFISREGAIDHEQVTPIHGLNIELNEGYTLNDIQHLPPDQVPPMLVQFVQYIEQSMTGLIPSLSPTFTGDAPFGGASGRAINALQLAAFTQASSNISAMNEFRAHTARIRLNHIQQFAKRPVAPHLWRQGLDTPDEFPEEARHIGFHVSVPAASAIPNTPVARLQLVQVLAQMGLQMAPERILELVGLDKGFGITADDFVPLVPQGVPRVNEDIASGAETQTNLERATQ